MTTPAKNVTTVRRESERELVVTRTFNGPARIVFEAFTIKGDAGQSSTTVTFEEKDGKTLLVLTELHPSKKALEEALHGSSEEGMVNEVHRQLDELLVSLGHG